MQMTLMENSFNARDARLKSIANSHKSSCKRPNYLLRVHLAEGYIVDPPVYRIISCPAEATFAHLNQALHVAFGWASCHAYDFKIYEVLKKKIDRPAGVERLGEKGEDEEWFAVRDGRMLMRITMALGFFADTLKDGDKFQEKESKATKLWEVLETEEFREGRFEYEYDFGDGWTHDITLEDLRPLGGFVCEDGEGHGVAEDAGSFQGWNDLKEAYRAKRPNQEQRERREWFEQMTANADPKGLKNGGEFRWDNKGINHVLARIN
ncbi:hypothetical protein MMC25_007696 [Agyrium rufum]|nr:hypothetical protein [Agyrium rufum]